VNCVLIVLDSWRQDHCGCYGNEWIHTPHLDALARESVLFTRAYPESLPTLPVRRALLMGRRVFPFWGHWNQKGDFEGAPGWGPVDEGCDTVPELLQSQGYRTALFTDTYHLFKPSKNFHRGFDEWCWIRGQESDPYRSGPPPAEEQVQRHLPEKADMKWMVDWLRQYLTNVADREREEDYFPAQVFRSGAEWLHRNQDASRFFMVLDSFDPHEPWDPPPYYRRLYDPDDDDVRDVIWSTYGAASDLTARELKRMRANYAGECTLVDRWLGYFLEALRNSGRLDDTIVAVISDHGHNLGDANITGKFGHPLTRAVGDLIMMIRHPGAEAAGDTCDALCYNFDLTVTLLNMLGEEIPDHMEGTDLWPIVHGRQSGRDHVTVAWGADITRIDDKWWINCTCEGKEPLVFDLEQDAKLTVNLAAKHPELVDKAVQTFREDAGGELPAWLSKFHDTPGCTPLLD